MLFYRFFFFSVSTVLMSNLCHFYPTFSFLPTQLFLHILNSIMSGKTFYYGSIFFFPLFPLNYRKQQVNSSIISSPPTQLPSLCKNSGPSIDDSICNSCLEDSIFLFLPYWNFMSNLLSFL